MKIILEGNECNFKSTIAEKLAHKLNYPVIKGSSFELANATNAEMNHQMLKMMEIENVIIDRYIYSNRVYATIFPQYTILTTRQYNYIDRMLQADDYTWVVYLYAGIDELKKRIKQRGDLHFDKVEKRLEVINDEFQHVFETSIVRPIRISTEKYGSNEIVNILLDNVKIHQEIQKEQNDLTSET